jgi:hypothetical protein
MRRQLQTASCLLIAGMFALTAVLAKDPAASVTKDTREPESREPATTGKAGARLDRSTLPATLDRLKLSGDQQQQVRQVVEKYNTEIDTVWKDFTKQYLDTIALESQLLATIEDRLDDSQRDYIHQQRSRAAHGGAADDRNDRPADRQGRRDARADAQESQPTAAVEEVLIVGVKLTPEQERAADTAYSSYSERLRDGKRRIHQLHTRILSLESEKLAQVERLLTDDQLTQLRKDREAEAAGKRNSNPAANYRNDK